MSEFEYDFVVIGAGSAGYWAAKTAGKLGAKVALVDPGPLGGLCILRGCMPTKALLRSTEVLHLAKHAHEVGVLVQEVGYDFPKMMARKAHWVEDFASYRRDGILGQQGFEFINEAGTFVDAHTLRVGERTITSARFLVSTGSVPWAPLIPGLTDAGYITSDEALEIAAPPKSLLVIGGGVIALEMGQFFHRLGTEVTFVIRGEHFLSGEDDDVAMAIQKYFVEEGMKVVNHAQMHRVEVRDGRKVLILDRGHEQHLELAAEEIMVCTGRIPNIGKLGLDAAGVKHETHVVPVDDHLRTSQPHIYAAGDATGRHFIVHVAIQEGIYAATHAAGRTQDPVDYRLMAWAIFSDPNVARVGLSERDCAKRGIPHVVGKYPFDDQGKAQVANLTKGFVKVIAHAGSGEILGAQIVGAEGADLLHEMIVAMYFRATCRQFLEIPHLHPTLAEIWLDPVEECEDQRASHAAEG